MIRGSLSLQWPNHFWHLLLFPCNEFTGCCKTLWRCSVQSSSFMLYKSCGSSDICFEVFGVSLKPLGPVSFVLLDDEFYTGRKCCLWKRDSCVEELPTYFLRLTSKYNKCCQGSLVVECVLLCTSVCVSLCRCAGLFQNLIALNYQTHVSVIQSSRWDGQAPSTTTTLRSFISS